MYENIPFLTFPRLINLAQGSDNVYVCQINNFLKLPKFVLQSIKFMLYALSGHI